MYRFKSNVDEILFLKKQINYELSHKGGAQKTKHFIKHDLKNKGFFIIIVFYICFYILIYTVCCNIKPLYKNPNNILSTNNFFKIKKHITGGGSAANIISQVLNIFSLVINVMGIITSPLFITIFSVISILCLLAIMGVILIIDHGIYVPCGGCAESGIYIKCISGTGKGTWTCDALNAIKNAISQINNLIKKMFKQIDKIKKYIKLAFNIIIKLMNTINNELLNILAFPLAILQEFFKFLKFLDIPDDWGFNLGELLLGGKTKDIIYHSNGKLRDIHGNNIFFKMFFKIIRIILEKPSPPKLDWPSFGGSSNIKGVSIIKDATRDPNNQESENKLTDGPSKESFTNKESEINTSIDVPTPDAADYDTYNVDIPSNEITDNSQNESITESNAKIEANKQATLDRKIRDTNKLQKKTLKNLEKIKDTKELSETVYKLIHKKQELIKTYINDNKIYLDDIKITLLPNFIKNAKIGTMDENNDDKPVSEIKLIDGTYTLINIQLTDLSKKHQKDFKQLNDKNDKIKLNTELININTEFIKAAIKKIEYLTKKQNKYDNGIKDYLFMKFLELLIQIDINPLKLLASLGNLILDGINKGIQEAIIKPSIALINLLFKLAKKVFNALIGELKKVGKLLLIPMYKLIDAFKPILKTFYKVFSIIKELGIFNMIFYYFYDIIESSFSFIGNIFILLFITIIAITIIIGCPIIGGYYELFLLGKSATSDSTYNVAYESIYATWNLFQWIMINIEHFTKIYKTIMTTIMQLIYILNNPIYIIVLISIIFIIIFGLYIHYRIHNTDIISQFIMNHTINLKTQYYNKCNNIKNKINKKKNT